VRLLRQPRDSFRRALGLTSTLTLFIAVMLVHLFLMLMKIEFIHARARAYFEGFDVACLTFHAAPSLVPGLDFCLEFRL
jgi:hypothetical protein